MTHLLTNRVIYATLHMNGTTARLPGWGGETTGDRTPPTHGGRAVQYRMQFDCCLSYQGRRVNLSGIAVTEQQADLADNERSTAQTVRRMCELIAESIQDPAVMRCVQAALKISDVTSRQWIAAACWEWCKKNIRFVQDDDALRADLGRADELELLISPAVLARQRNRRGDCDDYTMMLCAMLGSMGVPCLIKTFKCDRKDPARWAHVCAGAILEDGSLLPLDASHGDYPGWQVPAQDIFESCVWDMSGNAIDGGKGMGFTRRGGMGAYRNMPGWTGNPMSSTTGPEAGPYSPANDIRTLYQKQCDRMAGLGYIRRAGMGAPTVEGDYSTYYETPPASTSEDSGGGLDLDSFFSNLFKAGAQVGSAALGTGNKIVSGVPAGYAVNSAGQLVKVGTAASSGISTNTLLIGGGLLLGVVLLVALKK